MATTTPSVADVCRAAKLASRALAGIDTAVKNAALDAIALALVERMEEILEANERDMIAGQGADPIGEAQLDRLRLDEGRVTAIAHSVRQVAALPDPVGEVIVLYTDASHPGGWSSASLSSTDGINWSASVQPGMTLSTGNSAGSLRL